jgi:activator of Hsp90 ATPase-like protein
MIVKSVVLPISPDAAFALFTEKASQWWPAERRHTRDPSSEIVMLESGRFFERARDGREAELGRVRVWEAPKRILLDFFIATGPEAPTEVEVTFAACARGAEVTVIHRPKSGSALLWSGRAPRYAQSWDDVLAALGQAATP